jgi:GWxTD domain-containing protein
VTRPFPTLALGLTLAWLAGCGGSRTPSGRAVPTVDGGPAVVPANLTFDAVPLYRQAGLLARGVPMPFVARVGFVASPSADTTHAVVAVALGNNALSFTREADDRFRASYTVAITLRTGLEVVRQERATEEVIVGAFRETTRVGETLVFQQVLDVAPGEYEIVVALRDELSQRTAEEQMTLRVPRLGEGAVSSPLPVFEVTPRSARDSLPRFIVDARATAIFGRDSVMSFYVERYDTSGGPVRLEVRDDRGQVTWSEPVDLPVRGGIASRVLEVPVARIGIGVAEVAVVPEGGTGAGTGVFVGFGEELPVATFDNMLNYLRYFAAPHRLNAMRAASPERRADEWARFLRETDGNPTTAAHEDLRDYFARVIRANTRYRDESTIGWLSDRGRVYVTLGDPDQVLEPQMQNFDRVRQQVWVYRELNAQLVFYDETGAGRWRLTPQSNIRFEAESRRRLR